MTPLIICKNHNVFMSVCEKYGFNPKRVQFAGYFHDIDGRDAETPIFKYFSAGYPDWWTSKARNFVAVKFKNVIWLPEIETPKTVENFVYEPNKSSLATRRIFPKSFLE